MTIELVRAAGLAEDVPYAYAAVSGQFVFTAGACPLDDRGQVVCTGDVAGQAERVIDNLVTVLAAAGTTLADVTKTTVYVATSDRTELVQAWNVVRARFSDHDPPSTLVGVSVLGWPDQLVEVEAMAVRSR